MPDSLVFAAWLPKLTGTPILLDLHEPMPETYQARFEISDEHWLSRILLWQERISASFADHLITIHEPIAELFSGRSAPASKISAIMNVPDPSIFRKISGTDRSSNKRFTLLYTGSVTFRYGLDVAVHAVAKLRDTIPGICLRIVGEGDDLERVKDLVDTLRLCDYVEFLPPVSLDKIPELVSTADVALSPHRNDPVAPWYFSTKIAESLLLGLPVISSRTKTLTYYFNDSMVAYIEPGDADELAAQVVRLYRDPGLGARMVANSIEFFADHSWERERVRLYEVIDRLVKPIARNEELGLT